MLKHFGYENKAYYTGWEEPPKVYDIKVNSVTGSEPVTVSEAKDWALIDTSADDTIIGYMITSVREALETYLGADIVAKTRTYYDERVIHQFEVPFTPLDSISSITYTTDDTEIPSTGYTLKGLENVFIDFDTYPKEHVKVNYTTLGISDQRIKDAIKMTFEYIYNSRGLVSMDNFKGFDIPQSAKVLVAGRRKQFI